MLEYCTHLFERETIQRMARHWLALLGGIAEDPDRRIGTLPMLSEDERHSALVHWNRTDREYHPERCIQELFEAQVERSPASTAVVTDHGAMTYAELNSRANRLARHLREMGVGPGAFVAIHLDRGAAMVASVLAVLKAGAAYVPLESRLPPARMHWMLRSLRVSCLLTESRHLALLDGMEPLPDLRHVVCLDAAEGGAPDGFEVIGPGDWQRQSGDNLARFAKASDLAYVIFTSGSTGTPKGVMVAHRPVVNLIEWVTRAFRMGPDDQVLFITSLCFDLSVYDLFGLLAVGGSVRVVPDASLHDPTRLVEILATEPVTFWDSAPAALQQLVPFLEHAGDRTAKRPLRLVFLSGDWIPLTLPDRVRGAFPGAEIIGLGGATEATVWSNWHRIDGIAPHWVSIPYGRPIQNARYYALDPDGNPCPPGVPGELHIGGECLAEGYIDQPRLTAERFIPDPFSARPGGRLYRTGDRVRWWADGTMEFLGRLDSQVKIRGFRVELGEIEAVLARHPRVRGSVAVVREDRPGDRRLVAYVVPTDAGLSSQELRQFVGERVPEYLLPSAFILMDTIPATDNGKLDRQRLPAPDFSDRHGLEFVAPRSNLEEVLARIWAEVLGVGRVGIHDNFFELGGDSILSIQVVARAHEEGVHISPRVLFQHQTVAELAAAAERDEGAALPQGPVVGPVPLAPIQRWFFEHDFTDPHHWNQALLLRPKEPPDLEAVAGAPPVASTVTRCSSS
jgi:amino acid adenylation domain-containing protein